MLVMTMMMADTCDFLAIAPGYQELVAAGPGMRRVFFCL